MQVKQRNRRYASSYDIMTCSGSADAITLAIYSILTPTNSTRRTARMLVLPSSESIITVFSIALRPQCLP